MKKDLLSYGIHFTGLEMNLLNSDICDQTTVPIQVWHITAMHLTIRHVLQYIISLESALRWNFELIKTIMKKPDISIDQCFSIGGREAFSRVRQTSKFPK